MKFLLALLFLLVGFTAHNQTLQADEHLDEVFLLYAQVPESWENPHVWAFTEDGTPAYGELGWPGRGDDG